MSIKFLNVLLAVIFITIILQLSEVIRSVKDFRERQKSDFFITTFTSDNTFSHIAKLLILHKGDEIYKKQLLLYIKKGSYNPNHINSYLFGRFIKSLPPKYFLIGLDTDLFKVDDFKNYINTRLLKNSCSLLSSLDEYNGVAYYFRSSFLYEMSKVIEYKFFDKCLVKMLNNNKGGVSDTHITLLNENSSSSIEIAQTINNMRFNKRLGAIMAKLTNSKDDAVIKIAFDYIVKNKDKLVGDFVNENDLSYNDFSEDFSPKHYFESEKIDEPLDYEEDYKFYRSYTYHSWNYCYECETIFDHLNYDYRLEILSLIFDKYLISAEKYDINAFHFIVHTDISIAEKLSEKVINGEDSSLKKGLIVTLINHDSHLGGEYIDHAFTGSSPRLELFKNTHDYIYGSSAAREYIYIARHDYQETGKALPPVYCYQPLDDEIELWGKFINKYPWFPGIDDAYYRLAFRLYVENMYTESLSVISKYKGLEYLPDTDSNLFIEELEAAIKYGDETSPIDGIKLEDLYKPETCIYNKHERRFYR